MALLTNQPEQYGFLLFSFASATANNLSHSASGYKSEFIGSPQSANSSAAPVEEHREIGMTPCGLLILGITISFL
jgi:hypothetical protein